jgi:two-component system chemotaxis response regulator CheB
MAERRAVVIGASAGGLEALLKLVRDLPPNLPAAVFLVVHSSPDFPSLLPELLSRGGPLPAVHAPDGGRVRAGHIYVAPPDRHLLVIDGQVRVSRGPRQNGVRPAADPLFRSAALYGGPRVIGVVLSGTLDDAALGSATVERRGGRVIVQEPEECAYNNMPQAALAAAEHAMPQPAAKIPALITRLAREEVEMRPAGPDGELELEISGLLAGDLPINTDTRRYTGFTCPDCSGPLYHAQEDKAESYDCLVGHRWSPGTLIEEQSTAVERALWLAIRSLDERARLTERLAEAARQRGHELSAEEFQEAAKEAVQAADAIRKVANGLGPVPGEAEETESA